MSGSDLSIQIEGSLATVRLSRPHKRNALHSELVNRIGQFFAEPPPEVRVAVLIGEGAHFCAGLDLAENRERTVFQAMENSSAWHRAFDHIEHGRIPVVAALQGAVIGGGLELALAAHVRVADSTAFYSLPEGRLGIFVGGGGSVRVARVLGADRMREMMLTGRRLSAEDGQRLGISHELVDVGQTAGQAHAIALQIAGNAPLTNQLILTALPRIADMSSSDGLWAEALAAAVSQSTEDAIEGCALSSRNAHPSSAASDPSRPGTGQALALSRMRRAAAVYARRYFSDAPQGAIKTDALSGGEG